jgi:hypothetical protein
LFFHIEVGERVEKKIGEESSNTALMALTPAQDWL